MGTLGSPPRMSFSNASVSDDPTACGAVDAATRVALSCLALARTDRADGARARPRGGATAPDVAEAAGRNRGPLARDCIAAIAASAAAAGALGVARSGGERAGWGQLIPTFARFFAFRAQIERAKWRTSAQRGAEINKFATPQILALEDDDCIDLFYRQ